MFDRRRAGTFRTLDAPRRAAPLSLTGRLPPTATALLALLALASLTYYGMALGWSVGEAARLLVGLLALWGPLAGPLFMAMGRQIPDTTTRLTFSLIASYALTPLAYFALATFGLGVLFYAGQVALVAGLVVYAVCRRPSARLSGNAATWQRASHRLAYRCDWLLILLIAASLLVNIPYKIPSIVDPETGSVTILAWTDQVYAVGQAYELGRHTPPRQATIRAGTPERAYHLLSQLTTMLVGRYTGQSDLLRAHLGYHYTVLDVLMCLAVFSLARGLTGSRWAGYMAVSLLFILAITWPALAPPPVPNPGLSFFDALAWPPATVLKLQVHYFTLFPHASSGLVPVVYASPQMYSGVLVTYGALIGATAIAARSERGSAPTLLLVVTALMAAATFRFRAHTFLALFPGFSLLMLWFWWCRRSPAYLAAIVGCALAGALLYIEMRPPAYLPETTSIRIGNNHLADPDNPDMGMFVNAWPYAYWLHAELAGYVENAEALSWIWQALSMTAFVVLNEVGLPLAVATAICLLSRQIRPRSQHLIALICSMVVASLVGGMVLSMDYDAYSLGGQLLLHIRWYVYPFTGALVYLGYRCAQQRLRWSRRSWLGAGLALVALVTLTKLAFYDPVGFAAGPYPLKRTLSRSEQQLFAYLHDRTPPEAVVLANRYQNQYTFEISGLGGRVAYLEMAGSTLDRQAEKLYPADRRSDLLARMWVATDPTLFCELVLGTPATYVVEFAEKPLPVRRPTCLRSVWASDDSSINLWEVLRVDPARGA